MPPIFDFIFVKSPLIKGILQLCGALQLLQSLLMIKAAALLFVSLASLWAVAEVSAETGNDRVKVSAIADVSCIQPGKPFWVGINFTIKPGFHIYWKNPGDSGLATEIRFNLPEGFTAGEVMYPVPERLIFPGDITNYAYEKKVMLMTQITPPKNLATGKSTTFSAKVNWLACKDDCLPGSSNVSLQLPVADVAKQANVELFKSWGGRLPLNQDIVDVASCSTHIITDTAGTHGTIEINWKLTPTDILYLPGPLKTGDTTRVKVNNSSSDTTIRYDIVNRSDGDPVSGLVVFTTAAGAKIGLDVTIPVK